MTPRPGYARLTREMEALGTARASAASQHGPPKRRWVPGGPARGPRSTPHTKREARRRKAEGADGVSLSEARAPPRASRAVCRVPHTALGLRGAAGAAERVWGQRGHAAPLKTGLRRTVSDETGLLPAAASEHRQRERPRRVSRCGDRAPPAACVDGPPRCPVSRPARGVQRGRPVSFHATFTTHSSHVTCRSFHVWWHVRVLAVVTQRGGGGAVARPALWGRTPGPDGRPAAIARLRARACPSATRLSPFEAPTPAPVSGGTCGWRRGLCRDSAQA